MSSDSFRPQPAICCAKIELGDGGVTFDSFDGCEKRGNVYTVTRRGFTGLLRGFGSRHVRFPSCWQGRASRFRYIAAVLGQCAFRWPGARMRMIGHLSFLTLRRNLLKSLGQTSGYYARASSGELPVAADALSDVLKTIRLTPAPLSSTSPLPRLGSPSSCRLTEYCRKSCTARNHLIACHVVTEGALLRQHNWRGASRGRSR